MFGFDVIQIVQFKSAEVHEESISLKYPQFKTKHNTATLVELKMFLKNHVKNFGPKASCENHPSNQKRLLD